jgi:hypothetical protein
MGRDRGKGHRRRHKGWEQIQGKNESRTGKRGQKKRPRIEVGET